MLEWDSFQCRKRKEESESKVASGTKEDRPLHRFAELKDHMTCRAGRLVFAATKMKAGRGRHAQYQRILVQANRLRPWQPDAFASVGNNFFGRIAGLIFRHI